MRFDNRISVVEGITIRSALEARWAIFFSSFGLKWEYEPTSFLLRTGHTYTPDFKVKNFGWVEVKPTIGHLRESARKIKQFLAEHPEWELYALCSSQPMLRYGEDVFFSKRKIHLPTEIQMLAKLTKAREHGSKVILHKAIQTALTSANAAKIDHMVSVGNHFRFNFDKIAPVPNA